LVEKAPKGWEKPFRGASGNPRRGFPNLFGVKKAQIKLRHYGIFIICKTSLKNLSAACFLLLFSICQALSQPSDNGSFYHVYQKAGKKDLYKYWLQEIVLYRIKDGTRLLDVGGSDGKLIIPLAMVCDSLDYSLEDINPQNFFYDAKFLGLAQKIINPAARFTLHQITGTDSAIPINHALFDRIVVRETFHHFDHPEQMVREFYRLLAPAGLLIISEPSNQKKFKVCRLIPADKLIQIVEGEGFHHKSHQTTESEFTVFVFEKN
jgi:2-polyprenyl-3-methyl-5-hydroxy-6-metoxy-1,4-benzoquinol methylase